MSNDLVKVSIPSLAMNEAELIAVLGSSVYPGAKIESIKLAVGYCRAAGLDPLQKPVHIVPMDVKTGRKDGDGKDIYEKRDVIMPGVGLYRIQAARSNGYAGMTEPEFGPDKTVSLGKDDSKADYTFPEWCKVTVRRVVNGQTVEFTAIEYWIENYATAGKWTTAPNAMWKKRPRGQLAKCAEAQALRKAFPELGATPTADEMEGKIIEADVVVDSPKVEGPKAKSESVSPAAPAPLPSQAHQASPSPDGGGTGPKTEDEHKAEYAEAFGDKPKLLQDGQKRILRARLKNAGLTEIDLEAKFGKLDELPFARFDEVQQWASARA